MFGDKGRYEVRGDEFLPYLHHISPQVVALDDGSLLAMASLPGLPFELDENAVRNARPHRINALLQMISDDNVTIHVNFVHGDVAPQLVQKGEFLTNFAGETYRQYERKTFGDTVKANTWLISVIVHPRFHFEGILRKLKRRLISPRLGINEECERQLEDIMEVLGIWLARYGVRRLGLRQGAGQHQGWLYTEIGEALALIMTARPRTVPMANGLLGGMVYTDPVVFAGWRGRHSFAIERVEASQVGMIFGYKDYPSQTLTGMLNELLGVEYPVVVTHSGRFLGRASAQAKMSLKQAQMQNAADKAVSLLDGLLDLQDQIASNRAVMLSHHFSIAVYAEDKRTLANRASRVANIMSVCGATVARESRGAMGAYFAQLPGARSRYQCRPGAVSSRNFAHFVSLEGYPEGDREGYWGPPVMQFKTNGGTVYNWHPHVGEVGHTFFCGVTGSGKTLALAMVLCALQRSLTARDAAIVFDKDQGLQCAVMANGGSYVCLRRGTASGSAPLRVYQDTPRNTGHLAALFKRLIELDGRGGIEPAEEDRLHRGVQRQLKLPIHLRSLLGVKAFLGTAPTGAAARFAKWCRDGSYGWLFDNDEDLLTAAGQTRLAGFDFTDLLPNEERPDDGCAGAMAADIMFRMRKVMDGRRFVAIVDECRFYMDSIAGMIEDFALTGRKKEMILILAAQKPNHILDHRDALGQPSGLGKSILAQCPTNFLFPDQSARWEEYGSQGLGCTPAEFRFLKDLQTVTTNRDSQTKRRVMIRRHGASVVAEFDISGMDDEIAILSGRPDTAALMERIAAELGENASPDERVAEFKIRWRSLGRIARKAKAIEKEALV
jgi:type IV secretion system protein VirB4